jgi:hypothetical protein
VNQYRYKCPTEGCEIDTILVNVHEDVIEYFGFCCPFCQDHMVRDDFYQSERDKVQCPHWIIGRVAGINGDTNEYFCDKQSSRDTVLDAVRKKYIEFNERPCPSLAEKYNHACDCEYCGICVLDSVLEELRQSKMGKQGIEWEDPCNSCKYSLQACSYILDGKNIDDACIEEKHWLEWKMRQQAGEP